MKSLYETLAVLGAGAVLLTGCGSAPAPVNSAEVPVAAEAKPADPNAAAPTEAKTGDAAAAATMESAKPAADAKPADAAAPAAAPSAKPAVAPAAAKKTGKKTDAKKTGAAGSCGEGTCG